MKKIIFLLLTVFAVCCCSKDDDRPKTEVEKLPPATQIGANRIGCLLDGKALLPGKINNSVNCFYQFVDGEYYFVMAFNKRDENNNLIGVGIGTQKLQIQQDSIYNLFEISENHAYGAFGFGPFDSYTSQTNTGEFKITKLDEINHIVSGTFWFDVTDTYGVVHQIREGRFDFQYTN